MLIHRESLLHCLREFSLVALSVPLSSVSLADGGRAFIRLCGLIIIALARESGIHGTTIWFYYETIIGMYGIAVRAQNANVREVSFGTAFRVPSFHRELAREFSLRSFVRLELQNSFRGLYDGRAVISQRKTRTSEEKGKNKRN